MSTLYDLFGFSFSTPKEVKPVLTVDLASDIPARQFLKVLVDAGLTIVERQGRLMICKAGEKSRKKPRAEVVRNSN